MNDTKNELLEVRRNLAVLPMATVVSPFSVVICGDGQSTSLMTRPLVN